MKVVCIICHESWTKDGPDNDISHGVCAHCEGLYTEYLEGNIKYPTLQHVQFEGRQKRDARLLEQANIDRLQPARLGRRHASKDN